MEFLYFFAILLERSGKKCYHKIIIKRMITGPESLLRGLDIEIVL